MISKTSQNFDCVGAVAAGDATDLTDQNCGYDSNAAADVLVGAVDAGQHWGGAAVQSFGQTSQICPKALVQASLIALTSSEG